MDDIDLAQDRQAMDINLALSRIPRMDGKSATHCQECGDPIPEKRRLAIPGCQFCVGCQSELEGSRR